MRKHLQNRRNSTVISIICGMLVSHSFAQSNLHYFGTSGVIGNDVATGRSISSNNDVSFSQSNFVRSDKIQVKPSLVNNGFFITSKNTFNTHENFETTKPLPFVIPSYASGILNEKTTPIAANVSPPSELLLPPEVVNAFEATTKSNKISSGIITMTLNSIEPETTTLLPVIQRFNLASVTQRSNFNGQIDTTTIQSKPSVFTQKQNTPFTSAIPKTSFQFSTKSTTTPPPPSTTTPQTTTTQVPTTITTQSSSLFTTKFANIFEKPTLLPAFGLGFQRSLRDEILGNQKPGYAVKPDGTIDSEALPPQFILPIFNFNSPFTTEKPLIAAVTLPTATTTTTSEVTTQKLFTNFAHNPLPRPATPFQPSTSFFKQNSKPFVQSLTVSNQFPTTTDFQSETTTQFFNGFTQVSKTTPSKIGVQTGNGNVFGNGIRDRSTFTTTQVLRGQFANGSSPKPFIAFTTTTTKNPVTQSLNNFGQKNVVTQKPAFNGFSNNFIKNTVTQSSQKPQNIHNSLPNSLSGSSFQVPDLNLLPPLQANTQLPIASQTTTNVFNRNAFPTTLAPKTLPTTFSAFSTTLPTTMVTTVAAPVNGQQININKNIVTQSPSKPQIHGNSQNSQNGSTVQVPDLNLLPPIQENTQLPIASQTTTNIFNRNAFPTTLPPTILPTTFSIMSTTVPTTITTVAAINRRNQSSSNIVKTNENLLPPVNQATPTVTVHKSPAITLPSNDLLPPTTAVNVKAFTTKNDPKPSEFLPQLDLNPFLAPFLGSRSGQNSNDAQTTMATTSSPLIITTIKNSQVSLEESPFSYKKPAVPFIIQANVHGSPQQQKPIQSNANKYTGGFGAPPGVLTPYDNLNKF